MTPPDHERGTALLTVLLLVAVLATVASTALDRIGLATRLAGNARGADQARAWLTSAELIGMSRIEDLKAANKDKLTLAGDWEGVPRTIALPDGRTVEATLLDGGNCFNLNALVRSVDTHLTLRPDGLKEFAALMTAVGIDPNHAAAIAAGAADYIDEDDVPNIGGVERGGYPQGSTPANRAMADPSELRSVPGVTRADWTRLKPWVCALPVLGKSPVNLNTLRPEQAPLLTMLSKGAIDPAKARALIVARPPGGVEDANALTGGSAAGAGTNSNYLRLDIRVASADPADPALAETALVDATRVPSRVLSRQWGELD